MTIRLQRYLAQAGVASRRKAEDLVAAGLVRVNGRVVTEAGATVDPGVDRVELRGVVVRPRFAETSPEPALALALHKPAGVLTARSDPGGRPTVYDLIEEPADARLIYVGRLDRDTEGLLLFTTHGSLAHRLTHPRWEVERAYEVEVGGALDERRLRSGARTGLPLEGGPSAPYRVRALARRGCGSSCPAWRLELVLREGRKREVRRLVEACGGTVLRLIRTHYDFLGLDGLEPGAWRWLEPEEVARLLVRVDLPTPAPAGGGE